MTYVITEMERAAEIRRRNDSAVRDIGDPGIARADAKQVGGRHYADKAIQPWDVIESNCMGFFDGNALKYLMRYRDKGGVEDLKKAAHYIEKLIEMETKQ